MSWCIGVSRGRGRDTLQVLVEQELAQLAVGGHHLLQCGDLASQIALASQLLLQIDASQIVDQMVIVIINLLGSTLTGLDQLANRLGHLGF